MVRLSILPTLLASLAHSLTLPASPSNTTITTPYNDMDIHLTQRGIRDFLSSIADKIFPSAPVCHLNSDTSNTCSYACADTCKTMDARQGQETLLSRMKEAYTDCEGVDMADEVLGVKCTKKVGVRCWDGKVKCEREWWPWQW